MRANFITLQQVRVDISLGAKSAIIKIVENVVKNIIMKILMNVVGNKEKGEGKTQSCGIRDIKNELKTIKSIIYYVGHIIY